MEKLNLESSEGKDVKIFRLKQFKKDLEALEAWVRRDPHSGDSAKIEDIKQKIAILEQDLGIDSGTELSDKTVKESGSFDFSLKNINLNKLRYSIEKDSELSYFYSLTKKKLFTENPNEELTRSKVIKKMAELMSGDDSTIQEQNALKRLKIAIVSNEELVYGENSEHVKFNLENVDLANIRNEISTKPELFEVYNQAKQLCLKSGNYSNREGRTSIPRKDIFKKVAEILNEDRDSVVNRHLIMQFKILLEKNRNF